MPVVRGLGAVDVLLFFEGLGGHIFLADETRIGGRDVHGNVVHQALEVVGAGDEVALAVDFDQHADLASGVDVAGHRAFTGGARGLLGGGGNALLAQNDDSALDVALGFGEGVLAIHHGRVGFVTKFFYLCGGNVHGCSTHSFLLFAFRCSLFARKAIMYLSVTKIQALRCHQLALLAKSERRIAKSDC